MNWKKILAAGALTAAAAALLVGCGTDNSSQAEQKLPDKIVIGLDDNFPPMASVMKAATSSVSISTWLRKRRNDSESRLNLNRLTGTVKKLLLRASKSTSCGMA